MYCSSLGGAGSCRLHFTLHTLAYPLTIALPPKKIRQIFTHLSIAMSVAMFRMSLLALICLTLKDALAAPTSAVTIAPHPVLFASAPPLAPPIQLTLESSGHLRPRHRKVLMDSRPEEIRNPIPDKMERNHHKTRIPSQEQLSLIKNYISDHMAGSPYVLHPDGSFSAIQKPPGSLKYYYGRVEIFDEEGYSLYETPCCYGFPRSYCACFSFSNCAECCMTSAGCLCGFPIALAICSVATDLICGSGRLSRALVEACQYEFGRLSTAGYNAWQRIRAARNPTVSPISSEIQLS
ncbi:hypothetical protein PGTUg99_001416 [Puccinia graminis f. sp. tritici]|uniref:Uncharacterized protein n=2 Tax=Puccinia graminis f. sp. tritici TaxID=56615 RepID=A0A5B0RHC6_PUCGR|nr:hypothetical protein PGTUg99_001416 [Puccinia graminis f. sp. tritici]